jgi:hypothetical protein
LTVDFQGLPDFEATDVTLAGGPPGLDTDAGGIFDGLPDSSFNTPNAAVIPEPASLLLWTAGGFGLLLTRRRRTRKDSSHDRSTSPR